MIFKNVNTIALAAAAGLALLGCGSSKPSTTVTVGASGATLKAGVATLSIPAGAVTQNTQVTLREADVRHSGRSVRIEMEPNDLALAQPGKLSIKIDDRNVKVKMVDDNGGMNPVEVEDRNRHQFKTTMSRLGEVEVELEHGLACATACGANEECDDGQCKAHREDASKAACDPVCDSGQECDDGQCKTHNEFENENGGAPGICDPPCATGMECDTTDSVCKAPGGNSGP